MCIHAAAYEYLGLKQEKINYKNGVSEEIKVLIQTKKQKQSAQLMNKTVSTRAAEYAESR